jgi:hypothetical protein
MDDGLTLQRCQREESQAARIIRNTTALFSQFLRYGSTSPLFPAVFTLRPSNPIHPLPCSYCEYFQEITKHQEFYQRMLISPTSLTLHQLHSAQAPLLTQVGAMNSCMKIK